MVKAKKQFLCDPIEQCIYCGETEGTFSDEHVIPAGLDGTWTLPKASCKSCQEITSRFEMEVLRGFLHEPRIAMGSFTRRPQDRPATLPLIINDVVYSVPVHEHPANLLLVDFISPTFQTGDLPKSEIQLRSHGSSLDMNKVSTFYFKQIYPNLPLSERREAKKRGNHEIRVTTSVIFNCKELVAFVRLLAKIAHCISVARYGKERIDKNFIVPLILGKDNFYNHLVGTVPIEQPIQSLPPAVWEPETPDHPDKCELHRITHVREGSYWVAYIQLLKHRFSDRNPIHKIYVGEV
jgi:hypothetical protein